jgi:hypothetical protein
LPRPPKTVRLAVDPSWDISVHTLKRSTIAVASDDDATYNAIDDELLEITKRRNDIASQMLSMLEDSTFDGKKFNEAKAQGLIVAAVSSTRRWRPRKPGNKAVDEGRQRAHRRGRSLDRARRVANRQCSPTEVARPGVFSQWSGPRCVERARAAGGRSVAPDGRWSSD